MSVGVRPFVLIVLDGWGYREDKNNNAIEQAKKPNWDKFWSHYSHTLISGSGPCVGLPAGQMGNSEVGHLNMGAGRLVYQDLTRIDHEIETGEFYQNKVLVDAVQKANSKNKAVHIMGLLSPGGVHSHENHIAAMVTLASKQKAKQVYLHLFLDGRDTPPKSAGPSIKLLIDHCNKINCGKIISLIGRFYAMDRDKRWNRIEEAYNLITAGIADFSFNDPLQALEAAYARGETDEFVKATSISIDNNPIKIEDNDCVIFMNFRADRARELTQALTDKDFNEFNRKYFPKINFVCLSEYDVNFKLPVAYTTTRPQNILGEYVSALGLKQLRIAETEKYAHVTFFFNGGLEAPFPGEDRILIPSPRVKTYDLQPEMSAYQLTDQLVEAIKGQKYDLIIANYANPDMVGHTGNLPATIKAIETIDTCLGKVVDALQEQGGEALITADHGNAEMMFDSGTNQPHTAHTLEKVPLLYIGRTSKVEVANGTLSDIAPTLLSLLNLSIPLEMTGKIIFKPILQ